MKQLKMWATLLVAMSCVAFASCSDDDDEKEINITKFVLSQSTLSLTPEASATLTCTFYPDGVSNQQVEWKSSDESIATVSNGVVVGVKPGSAVITATPAANPQLAQSCSVSVAMNQLSVSGSVEGTWDAYTTVSVTGQLKVEAGKSLTIEEGVEVIFNAADAQGAGIEFTVNGNIYCRGTEANPILFSIPESQRQFANVSDCKNLWGGFMLNSSDAQAEALFEHCILEYAGCPMIETSPSVVSGIYTAGEDFGVQITTGPVFKGSLVVTDCTLRNGYADAIYMQGGKGIITRNVFSCNGATGGEAVNVKAGTSTTVCYNLMYSPNTNGLKLSSSGQDDAAGRGQALCAAYNNTIVNAGWRRDGNKGGCIYVEKNILANVFNNLMINCKYRAMTPNWGNPGIKYGCDLKSVIDYNCYISGSITSDFAQDQEEGAVKTPWEGYTYASENYYDAVDSHSLWAKSAGDIDISFSGFPYDTNKLSNITFDAAWDFHPTTAPQGATDDASLTQVGDMDYTKKGLTLGGKEYKAAAPQAVFGAF